MSGQILRHTGQLERELAYYRRECNDLGARLLRLQEEQSRAFREARRSRMVAKLIREAYRLADAGSSPSDIGLPMLGVIVENAMCDAAAFLAESRPGSGEFSVSDVVGISRSSVPAAVSIVDAPPWFFTTANASAEQPAKGLTGVLPLPFVFWAYDRVSGHALILGNRRESNVSRAFEAGDQELIEGALSVYLDVLARKQAEYELRQAQASAVEAGATTAIFSAAVNEDLCDPLAAIVDGADRLVGQLSSGSDRGEALDQAVRLQAGGRHLASYVLELADYGLLASGRAPIKIERLALGEVLDAAADANRAHAMSQQVAIAVEPAHGEANVMADRFRLLLLVRCLVGNAVRSAPAFSSVRIKASRDAAGCLEIAVRHVPGRGDGPAGPGRFPKADPQAEPRAERSPGAGLQLPIPRELCESLGGWLIQEGDPHGSLVLRAAVPSSAAAQAD